MYTGANRLVDIGMWYGSSNSDGEIWLRSTNGACSVMTPDIIQTDGTIRGGMIITSNGANLDELNSKLTWKAVGEITGTTELALPSTWSELQVSVTISDNIQYSYPVHITKTQVDRGVRCFYFGFIFTTSTHGGGAIYVSSNKLYLFKLYYGGVVKESSAIISVYYR